MTSIQKILVVVLCIVLGSISLSAQSDFAGGAGTPDDPYLIATAEQLAELQRYIGNEHRGTHFKVTNDLSLSSPSFDTAWQPIGYFVNDTLNEAFEGVLDGNGKTIRHLTVSGTSKSAGLFGYLKGTLRDIILDSVSVTGSENVGGVCGIVDSGEIVGCIVRNGALRGGSRAGGMVGSVRWSRIRGCSAQCSVKTSGGECGGFTGRSESSAFSNCTSSATVTSNEMVAGGFVGWSFTSSYYVCASSGKVSGYDYCGGFAGWSESGLIDSCTAIVDVAGEDACGGLVGFNNAPFKRCRASGTIIGAMYTGGLAGHNADTVLWSHFSGAVSGTLWCGGAFGLSSGFTQYCSSEGSVVGRKNTGGFAGHSNQPIADCYSGASVNGDSTTGGFVGRCEMPITRCYATGQVTGKLQTGGFAGDGAGKIYYCFATGNVTGNMETGGFIGVCNVVNDCYATGEITAKASSSGGFVGKPSYNPKISNSYTISHFSPPLPDTCTQTPAPPCSSCYFREDSRFTCNQKIATVLNLAEMGKQSSFTGWNFDSIWTIQEGVTYPYFKWQNAPVKQNYLEPPTVATLSSTIRHVPQSRNQVCPVDGTMILIDEGTYQITLHSLAGQLISSATEKGPAVVRLRTLTSSGNQMVIVTVVHTGSNGLSGLRIE